eukprot:UN31201
MVKLCDPAYSEVLSSNEEDEMDGALNIEDVWLLKIKCLGGPDSSVTISPSTTVLQLKERIETLKSISPEQQRLIFRGRMLDDKSVIGDVFSDGDTLHLVTRPNMRQINQTRAGNSSQNRSQPSSRPENGSTNTPSSTNNNNRSERNNAGNNPRLPMDEVMLDIETEMSFDAAQEPVLNQLFDNLTQQPGINASQFFLIDQVRRNLNTFENDIQRIPGHNIINNNPPQQQGPTNNNNIQNTNNINSPQSQQQQPEEPTALFVPNSNTTTTTSTNSNNNESHSNITISNNERINTQPITITTPIRQEPNVNTNTISPNNSSNPENSGATTDINSMDIANDNANNTIDPLSQEQESEQPQPPSSVPQAGRDDHDIHNNNTSNNQQRNRNGPRFADPWQINIEDFRTCLQGSQALIDPNIACLFAEANRLVNQEEPDENFDMRDVAINFRRLGKIFSMLGRLCCRVRPNEGGDLQLRRGNGVVTEQVILSSTVIGMPGGPSGAAMPPGMAELLRREQSPPQRDGTPAPHATTTTNNA